MLHKQNDGQIQVLDAQAIEDRLYFETPSFSDFAIAQKVTETKPMEIIKVKCL